MRILHLADIHYGRGGQFAWIDRAMTHAVDTAIAENCQLAVLAGDSFDRALTTHEPAFTAFVRQVMRLASYMPVVVLQGNHEKPHAFDVLRAIPTVYKIIVADCVAALSVAGVRVCTLPSLNAAEPESKRIGSLLEFMGKDNANLGFPTILVAHGIVSGCSTESRFTMTGPGHQFTLNDLASAECDAVMLGDIHLHQHWDDVVRPSGARTTIAYPGSLARLVHGHHAPVGFLIWEVSPFRRARYTFHESPSRKMIEKDFDGPPDMDELRKLAAETGPDDAVRIQWTVDQEQSSSIDKVAIRALFANVKLKGRVRSAQRVRAAGIGKATTLSGKLAFWAKTTRSEGALDVLLEKLAALQSKEVDSIITETIK